MSSEIYMLAQAVQEYEKPVVMFNEFIGKILIHDRDCKGG